MLPPRYAMRTVPPALSFARTFGRPLRARHSTDFSGAGASTAFFSAPDSRETDFWRLSGASLPGAEATGPSACRFPFTVTFA